MYPYVSNGKHEMFLTLNVMRFPSSLGTYFVVNKSGLLVWEMYVDMYAGKFSKIPTA